MSNTISVKDINKLRKIKKNMYIRIKKSYESKYKDIDIDACKKIYKIYDKFDREAPTQSDIDILKNGIDKKKNPFIKMCKDRLQTIVQNVIDTKDVNINNYCYPDYNQNNFSENIVNRFEFSIKPIQKENCEEKKFNLAPYQIFLKNFISDSTPYNSILIYHGTGTGKTCSGISIAENFRDIYGRREKKVIILSPSAVEEGWRKNIYNPEKEKEQCTSDTYVNLMEKRKINQNLNIQAQQKKLVNKYYEIMGYGAFGNIIKKIIHVHGNKSKKYVKELFSNRVLIIDEAHNIRGDIDDTKEEESSDDTNKKSSDDNIEYIKFVTENANNLKLILLSATPMYNTASEIVELINLMLSNDKCKLLNPNTIFNRDELINGPELAKQINGYISYIRGETLDKFPVRLYPTKNIVKSKKIEELTLYECLMSGEQKNVYEIAYKELYSKDKLLRPTEEDKLMQISNIIYPNKKDIKFKYGSEGLKSIFNINDSFNRFTYKKGVTKIFEIDKLENYSTKIFNLLNKIKNSEGIIFIYTRHVKSGVIPLMLALEQNGYKHYSGNNILNENVKDNGFKYISITGDKDLSKNNDKEIERLTSEENKYGQKIKIIIGSRVTSEGLDLKNIREIHVLEPWYHLKKLEQVIGRGVRYCSHKDLEEHEKNVTIYLYASLIQNRDINIDIDIYSKAEKKSKQIDKVEKILKENSIDCSLYRDLNKIDSKEIKENRDKIVLENVDIDNYKDDYHCKSDKKTKKKNMNTINHKLLKNMYRIYIDYIKELFSKNTNYNLEEIIEKIKNGTIEKNINTELIYLTLRNMIENENIIENNGRRGKIIYINENYIFQPLDKRDTFLSIYDREINQKVLSDKFINLKIKEKKGEKEESNVVRVIDIKTILEKIEKNKKLIDKNYKELEIKDKIKYDFVIERLSFEEKRTLIESALEKDVRSEKLNDIVLSHFRYNIFEEPLGYVLIQDKKPVYIIKAEDKYETANRIYEKKIKKLYKIKKIERPENYYTFNSKNKSNKTVLKIVIYDDEKKKYSTNTCDSTNQVLTIEDRIKIFREYNPDLYKKYESFFESNDKKDIICNGIELILRTLETDKMMYHINYDYYELLQINKK